MFPRVWENFRLNVKCFKVFCSTEEPSYWGPVHTNPFSNENGTVFLRHDRLPDHSTVSIQNGGQTLSRGFDFAGRYIEMRMCRVHLSMWTEGMKAFSKQIRHCSVDGRKRYENDKCGRKSFWKRSKTAPFSFENGLVWTGPEHLENTWKIDRVLWSIPRDNILQMIDRSFLLIYVAPTQSTNSELIRRQFINIF